MLRLLLIGLLLALPMGLHAETWLRGRGGEVWIEQDGKYQPPRENHRGFSRVAATQRPVVYVDPPVERYYSSGPTIVVRQPVYITDSWPSYSYRPYYGRGRYYYDHLRPRRYRHHGYRSYAYRGHRGRRDGGLGSGYQVRRGPIAHDQVRRGPIARDQVRRGFRGGAGGRSFRGHRGGRGRRR